MDWLEKMNGAISYIEDHLTSEVSYEEAARIAACSTYHFQRMFSFITEVPLSEYIRRRRLTLAAFELQNNPCKIIDLALKYGYDSPNSFTRAFQNLHGVTPTLARHAGVQLKAYPRMSFLIFIKGDIEMNYRIEEKGAFKVFGVETVVEQTNSNNEQIPQFWYECNRNGTINRLSSIEGTEEKNGLVKINSVLCYRNTGENTFPYMIGIIDFKGTAKVPEDLTTIQMNPCTWAIFKSEEHTLENTSEKIQAVWKRIFSEWFPTSGYEHAGSGEMELTYEKPEGKYYSEVWIPVVKK